MFYQLQTSTCFSPLSDLILGFVLFTNLTDWGQYCFSRLSKEISHFIRRKKGVKSATPMPDYDTYKKGSYHDFDVGGDNPPRWEKQPKSS